MCSLLSVRVGGDEVVSEVTRVNYLYLRAQELDPSVEVASDLRFLSDEPVK